MFRTSTAAAAIGSELARRITITSVPGNIGVVQLVSRWGARLAVGGAAALAALGMLAIALADGVVLLAVGVLVAGAAAGMAFPPYADIVDREVAPSRRDMV